MLFVPEASYCMNASASTVPRTDSEKACFGPLNRTLLDAACGYWSLHSIRKGVQQATYCCSGTTSQWLQVVLRLSSAIVELGEAAWAKSRTFTFGTKQLPITMWAGRIVAGAVLTCYLKRLRLLCCESVSPPHFCANDVPAEVGDSWRPHSQLVFPSIVSIEWRFLAEMFCGVAFVFTTTPPCQEDLSTQSLIFDTN
jgi:hypothetical protein